MKEQFSEVWEVDAGQYPTIEELHQNPTPFLVKREATAAERNELVDAVSFIHSPQGGRRFSFGEEDMLRAQFTHLDPVVRYLQGRLKDESLTGFQRRELEGTLVDIEWDLTKADDPEIPLNLMGHEVYLPAPTVGAIGRDIMGLNAGCALVFISMGAYVVDKISSKFRRKDSV